MGKNKLHRPAYRRQIAFYGRNEKNLTRLVKNESITWDPINESLGDGNANILGEEEEEGVCSILQEDYSDISCDIKKKERFSLLALQDLIDKLYTKRASDRETVLLELVDALEGSVLTEHLESWCITICDRCTRSLDEGSTTYESYLASRIIGLLAVTTSNQSNVREMMESISHLFSALEFGLSFRKLAVLDCLAITTYFGTKGRLDETTLGIDVVDEIEMVMGIIWEILPSLSTSFEVCKALSAWSLLLSNIDGWRISPYMWKESLSVLSILLQNDDCWVRIAAAEAVAVIFETRRLERFSKSNGEFDEIISTIRRVVYEEEEEEEEGKVNRDISHMQQSFKRVLEFIETGNFLKVSIRICDKEEPLKVSTFVQYLQLKYLKHFLGRNGFFNHLKDNKKIHALLGYYEEEEEREEFCAEECKMMIMHLMEEAKSKKEKKPRRGRTDLRNMLRPYIMDPTTKQDLRMGFFHYSDEEY